MAHVLIPIPSLDFDPSEVAISWAVLTARGHRVSFATPYGLPGEADPIMVTGRGLDPWSRLPILGRLVVIGRMLGANRDARAAYAAMLRSAEFAGPLRWDGLPDASFDALLLGGGHRARGMRPFLEDTGLQALIVRCFAADKPVAAICHGVLLLARSRDADGRSVLHGRRTTALTWALERTASRITRVTRFWDRHYYRTYVEAPGEPEGFMSVEAEVTRALADPADFLDVPRDHPDVRIKTSGTRRDTVDDPRPAWVVRDGRYVSARWPGDAHTFAGTFADVLDEVFG